MAAHALGARLVLTVLSLVTGAVSVSVTVFVYLLDKHDDRPHVGVAVQADVIELRQEMKQVRSELAVLQARCASPR